MYLRYGPTFVGLRKRNGLERTSNGSAMDSRTLMSRLV
jgi:hypothetical protein